MSVPIPAGWRRESEEVYYAAPGLTLVDDERIDILKRLAVGTERRRCRLCAHRDSDDALHEMLIVHARDAYVRPHLHLDKSESLHVIEGTATLVEFDEEGGPRRLEALGAPGSGLTFYYRMPQGCYHMLLIDSDWFVFHETVQGPFERQKTRLAPWSPEDHEDQAKTAFLDELRALARSLGSEPPDEEASGIISTSRNALA